MKSVTDPVIYCFWTGHNAMSEDRKKCLSQMRSQMGVQIILVTPDNLAEYILPDHPLHEAYQYLSETHKADYLRTYFMHFFGGGYQDIKPPSGHWNSAFLDMQNNPDCIINGYRETTPSHIANPEVNDYWNVLVGNGAYVVRPMTEFTSEWYREMTCLLDTKLDELRNCPSTHPQDSRENGNGYPVEWNEMLGRIFHKLLVKYIPNIMYTVPRPIFAKYR